MRILVTGARGMLGTDVCSSLMTHHQVLACDIDDFNITDSGDVERFVMNSQPEVIVHCAAYTNVDGCEQNHELAYQINSEGTANLARAAAQVESSFLYVSTDYVFDGEKGTPYFEDDLTHPLGVYGDSKLRGEEWVRKIVKKSWIVRTAWLFGLHGKNFVRSILQAAQQEKPLRVVKDQVGSPTYTFDLARKFEEVIQCCPPGIYHVTNSGSCTWYELAVHALACAGLKTCVTPIKSEEWSTPTRRPEHSVLSHDALERCGLSEMRSWQEAVEDYVSHFLSLKMNMT